MATVVAVLVVVLAVCWVLLSLRKRSGWPAILSVFRSVRCPACGGLDTRQCTDESGAYKMVSGWVGNVYFMTPHRVYKEVLVCNHCAKPVKDIGQAYVCDQGSYGSNSGGAA